MNHIEGAELARVIRTPRSTSPESYLCPCGRWNPKSEPKCYCGEPRWMGWERLRTTEVPKGDVLMKFPGRAEVKVA